MQRTEVIAGRRLGRAFDERSVDEVARNLIGRVVRHGETAGRVVGTESDHEEEPASHAFVGITARSRTLSGRPDAPTWTSLTESTRS